MRQSPSLLLIAAGYCALGGCVAAAEPRRSEGELVEEIQRLLVDLDSNDFSVRTAAFKRLEGLTTDQAARQVLAESVERVIVDADISFEVRKQLERLRQDLPPARLPPSLAVDAGMVDRLLAQLADDSYARRLGAESRLRWLLGNAEAADLIYRQVNRRAASREIAEEEKRCLRQIYDQARAAWLEADSRASDPAASADQIAGLVKRLAASAPQDRFPLTGEPAVLVMLRDLLASDANIAPIRKALEARLAEGGLSADAEHRLTELVQLTRPAMVAEFWNEGRHSNVQRLLVGVPSVTEGLGTSHFDRIDDRTAHVVSGVNLSAGDYPVGVAIPHPSAVSHFRSAFFHLVNLPTPRRRMAYEYRVNEDEAARYAAVAARTLEYYLARKTPLQERELAMITQFDPRKVSTFAGKYLATVEDFRPPDDSGATVPLAGTEDTGQPGVSIHAMLCSWLVVEGTQDAAAGLLAASQERRVLPPSRSMPYRFEWLAALAIARRDPWLEVDQWLQSVLDCREGLVQGKPDGPELGATAAAILLQRHGGRTDDFGLVASGDPNACQYDAETYRYRAETGPAQVTQWWKQRQEAAAVNDSAALPMEERR